MITNMRAMMKVTVDEFLAQHSHDDDLSLAKALVSASAQGALATRSAGLDIHQKTNISDVVTQADLWAEDFTATVLRTLRPEDGLLGEEGTRHESLSGKTWVIDPVDGTFNFASGMDYFCSALALVQGDPSDPDQVLFGAVHRPVTHTTWFGGTDMGTFIIRGEEKARKLPALGKGKDLQHSCLSTYLHPTFFNDPIAQTWQGLIQECATLRILGSASIDLAHISEGSLDIWAQINVCDWDWLPGRALVEGVGGKTAKVYASGHWWSIAGAPATVDHVLSYFHEQ